MRYSEQTLQSWTLPLSQTEEQRAEHAISMIRNAIATIEELRGMTVEVFIQGSYANNTNVRTESDVDVCVMLRDTFHTEFPHGKSREDYGFISSDLSYSQYRSLVKKALLNKFGAASIKESNKSLQIIENTYHVKADVVPTFMLRNYYYNSSVDPNNYIEGTWFQSMAGQDIANYPKRHIQNGRTKNNATNHEYKKLVRIMKHIKNNMVDDGLADGNVVSSFLVECLIYQIPNSVITGYSSWTETVMQAISYLYNEINENRHAEWAEVSGMLYLFRGRKWLYQAWNYLGYGN